MDSNHVQSDYIFRKNSYCACGSRDDVLTLFYCLSVSQTAYEIIQFPGSPILSSHPVGKSGIVPLISLDNNIEFRRQHMSRSMFGMPRKAAAMRSVGPRCVLTSDRVRHVM